MFRICLILSLILALSLGLSACEEVTFPDANLEAVIRDAIGKPTGEIFYVDLLPLTTLDGSGKGIIDLNGLEYCINLTSFKPSTVMFN